MKSFEQFKTDLGARESGNRYNIKNKYGYLGRYQFGMARLKELGYTGTPSQFLNSPDLQETYFIKHVKNHAAFLSPYLSQAQARLQGLTLSGLVAFAHLVGAGAARNWSRTGTDKRDGNGVPGTTYAAQFSGYELPGVTETTTPDSGGGAMKATHLDNAPFIAGFSPLVIFLLIGAAIGLLAYNK